VIRGGWLGLGETSGPDHEPRPNSFTRQLPTPAHETKPHSTILLVNASQKFQTPKTHHPRENNKRKQSKNDLQLLLFANWVSHSIPLKNNSTSNSDAFIGTTKEKINESSILTHSKKFRILLPHQLLKLPSSLALRLISPQDLNILD
jgi:hypothetical protein